MKNIITGIIALIIAVFGAGAQGKDAQVKFNDRSHDFGTIKESNGPVTHEFEFKNTGKEIVSIVRASASCGCTKPKYSEEPIKPGKKGKVTVTYNPSGRPGEFDRKVTVRMRFTSGKEKRYILRISGVVIPESEEK